LLLPYDSPGARFGLPTLTIVNGRVWTGDSARPWAEAIAVEGEHITNVGTTPEIRALGTPAREIDARGGLVAPGFIDAHIHLVAGGFRLTSIRLRDAASREELAARLQTFASTQPDGTWITGGDWDHERWGGALPSHDWIDAATSRHPAWLNRLDGHMALANSLALRLAGVGRHTADPAGGAIVRDAGGNPTGLFKDNALSLVDGAVPRPTPAEEDRALDAAMRYVAAHGVTSVHHMGAIPARWSWSDLAVFRRAHRNGALRTRIYASVPLETWTELVDLVRSHDLGGEDGRGDAWLRVGAVKGFVDGSLGSRTAAFHEPFNDAPGECGLFVNDRDALRGWIAGADAAGLQPVVHAIGDRANTLLLDLFETAAATNGPRDRRFRVEHAQHLRPADIPRLGTLGVIASMQPYHAIDDGQWAERAIGAERAKTSFAWRSLLDAGARLAFGSDWFVAPPVPIDGLSAAVTRRTLDGRHPAGWIPAERITLTEALRAYTADAAYASFEEHIKGRLAPGFLADVVVLDRNLFALQPEHLADARVAMTVVGGRIVLER
jgi:hypothetical protein